MEKKEVLYVGKDRNEESLAAFYRQVIKGSRYLLLKNKDKLRSDRNEPSDLQQLLVLNRRLEKVLEC